MAIPYIGTWDNTPPGGTALPFRDPSNVPPVLRPDAPSGVTHETGYIILSSGITDHILLSQGGFVLLAGTAGQFSNIPAVAAPLVGMSANNTPPVAHAASWAAADNTSPVERDNAFPPGNNSWPVPADIPIASGVGPANNSKPVARDLGGAMSNVPPVPI